MIESQEQRQGQDNSFNLLDEIRNYSMTGKEGHVEVACNSTAMLLRMPSGSGVIVVKGELRCKVKLNAEGEVEYAYKPGTDIRSRNWCERAWMGLVDGLVWNKDAIAVAWDNGGKV